MRYHQFENKQTTWRSYYFCGKIRKVLMLPSVSTSFLNHLSHSFLSSNRRIRDCILESNWWDVNFHFQWKNLCILRSINGRTIIHIADKREKQRISNGGYKIAKNAKFKKTPQFLTTWYALVRVSIRG